MSPTAARRLCRTLATTLLLAAPGLPLRGLEVAFDPPVAAGGTASGEARLTSPPTRIEIPAGASRGSAMGSVAPDRPAEFLFQPPSGAMISVGASSKSGEARLSLYRGEAEKALAGTAPSDGAIRWIGALSGPEALRIVVHTRGAETPVRVEVSIESPAEEEAPVK